MYIRKCPINEEQLSERIRFIYAINQHLKFPVQILFLQTFDLTAFNRILGESLTQQNDVVIQTVQKIVEYNKNGSICYNGSCFVSSYTYYSSYSNGC